MNKRTSVWLTVLLLAALTTLNTPAAPPPAPPGFKWVSNEQFCDEFNAAALDTNKWLDHFPSWKGRAPAKFVPSAVSITNGCLELRAGTLPQADGPFTLAGGAVQSRREEAHYGYYEARMKASKISMSSTFWLSGGRRKVGDAVVSQEIDITETVGAPQPEPAWATNCHRFMNANTHFFLSVGGKRDDLAAGNKAPLEVPSGDAFHTYGAWWVDANTIKFYLNDEYKFTIHPKTNYVAAPFDHPMHVNMVAETYDWQKPPTLEAVTDPAINTVRYDWVRAYVLAGEGGQPLNID